MRRFPNRFEVVVWLGLCASLAHGPAAPGAERLFSVEDDIGLSLFEPDAGSNRAFSADHRYFALRTERGNLEKGAVEDTLWVYRTADVDAYIRSGGTPPAPVVVTRRLAKKAPAIVGWQWAATGSTLGFVDNSDPAHRSLFAVDVPQGRETQLSSEGIGVGNYYLHDPRNFLYTQYIEPAESSRADRPAIVETGRDLFSIVAPNSQRRFNPLATKLVSVRDGVALTARDETTAIRTHEEWIITPELIVSPDGTRAITEWSVDSAPASWGRLYPPREENSSSGVRVGDWSRTYAQIDLRTGTVRPLIDAPTADAGGWWLIPASTITPQWSSDGKYILLPESYLPSVDGRPSEPCVAVFAVRTDTMECVDKVWKNGSGAKGPKLMMRADFVAGRSDLVRIVYRNDDQPETRFYERKAHGNWMGISRPTEVLTSQQRARNSDFRISVIEDLNTPPRLEVRRGERRRILLDPNGGLSSVLMGKVEVFRWSDGTGRTWKGGLYLPPDYKPGRRYPLVIQTHGFTDDRFIPSGYAPTAFAARALTSHGMVVLQVDEQCGHTFEEMDCAAAAYGAAVRKLTADDIADPERVGLIGFSRTCLYVMRTLTAGGLPIAAASVNDGTMGTYWQHIMTAGLVNDLHERDGKVITGAAPFGQGLQKWLERSPGFNLDKVTAPLMVTAESPENVLYMWDIYAGLYYLKKPVELVMLNIDEHVLSNPPVRLASQGGTVDWFRFWLKGEEDPDPSKADQYRRWRAFRESQGARDRVPTYGTGESSMAVRCSPGTMSARSMSTHRPTPACTGAG